MKLKQLFALTAISAAVIPSLTSCDLFGKKDEVGGENLVQIRCYEGGYGVSWIQELVRQFNETFKDEGIAAKLVEYSSNVTTLSKEEIVDVKNNQIDLYFTNGSDMTKILQSNSTLKNQVYFECLDDILESKAIGVDGVEEEKTIGERLYTGFHEACSYNGYKSKIFGKTYTIPWAGAFTGVFANTEVLDKFGIEVPLTSNEFKTAVETIYANRNAHDGILPYAFGGNNCAGYFSYLFETWFAQYSGQEKFIKWMKCEPEAKPDDDPDVNIIKERGYEVYQDTGILKAMEAMFGILDMRYTPTGSANMKHIDAQTKFVKGQTGFFVTGDWVMNEMKENYGSKQNNIIMLKTPILSSIGEECGLTDAQLHTVVEDIDEGKDDAAIKADVSSISDDSIARIRQSRRVVNTIGPTHETFIPSYCDAKAAAKKFLRFMYSNYGCNVFRKNALGNLPFEYTLDTTINGSSSLYMQSLDAVYNSNPIVISSSADYNQVRSDGRILQFNKPLWAHVDTYKNIMLDKIEDEPKFSANRIFTEEAEYVENQWSTFMERVNF